jgi:hypothetical protein
MPVVASELIAYAAASMPTDDVSAAGGAIDPLRRVVFTDLAANDDVEVISSSAGDTQNCTIVARLASGVLVTETLALTGTTAKIFAGNGVVERIQSVELASAAIGTITVRRSVAGATIGTIIPTERGFMRLFRNASSNPSATRTYHEKFFWKNTNASLALLGVSLSEAADPTGLVDFALESSLNGSGSVANRLTAPGAIAAAFSNAAKLLSTAGNADLAAASAIGMWARLSLAIGNAPIKSTWTSQIDGTTA